MNQHALDHKWDLVDAVGRSPLLGTPQIAPGIELAEVERILLGADGLPAAEKERLISSARELYRARVVFPTAGLWRVLAVDRYSGRSYEFSRVRVRAA